MKNIEWIVLDDMKMNLIAALIVLILAASFTKVIDLPFRLTEVKKEYAQSGTSKVRSTKILVFRKGDILMVGIGEQVLPLEEAEPLIKKVNPSLSVILAVERNSGLSYDRLVGILAILKSKDVRNVSLQAKTD